VLLSIIFVNLLLSGDNAIVIAMATRNLPRAQERWAIFWGCAAAIALRIALILLAAQLLVLPYVKLVGCALLLYIGIQLLAENDDNDHVSLVRRHHSKLWKLWTTTTQGESEPTRRDYGTKQGRTNMWGAIRTILAADLVMSLDNIVAVAAVAQRAPANSRLGLLFVGLGISIPIIIFASNILVKLMHRFPIIVLLGAGFLGFLAGELLAQDPAFKMMKNQMPSLQWFGVAGAALVLTVGTLLKNNDDL